MRELLLVLRMKMRGFVKELFSRNPQTVLKNLSSVLIFGGFAVGVFFVSRGATRYLLEEAHIGQFLFHRFLSMLLYVFFVTVNLGNLIVCYATLYRSQEVSFLMAMPITHAKIFLLKFVDNFFYSSGTLSLVGFAVLLGYGSVFDFPWYSYLLTVVLVILPFMLIAAVLAVITLMALIKVAARIGVRWLLGLIIVGYLSLIFAYFKITNPVMLVGEVMKHYPDVNEYFGYLDPPFVKYLPNHWVTEFFYWSINGDSMRAVANLSLLFFTMLGLIAVAALIGRRYYYESWLVASDAQAMGGPRAPSSTPAFFAFGRKSRLAPQTEVVLKRDVWMFLREPSQWLHLLLMLLLICIFTVSMGSVQLRLVQPLLLAASFLVVFLFSGFLIASLTLRFVFPAMSLEGETFWAVRTSPLSLRYLYWHKFSTAFVAILALGEFLTVFSIGSIHRDTVLLTFGALCTGFIALAMTSMNLGAGVYFAAFRERNPIRVASSQGASVTFLLSMLYLMAVVVLLVIPLNRYFEVVLMNGSLSPSWIIPPVIGVGALSLLCAFVATNVGLRSLRRDF